MLSVDGLARWMDVRVEIEGIELLREVKKASSSFFFNDKHGMKNALLQPLTSSKILTLKYVHPVM